MGPLVVAIVRDLAAIETPFDDLDCVLCGAYRYHVDQRAADEIEPQEHHDDCPYRRAIDWVAATDGHGQVDGQCV